MVNATSKYILFISIQYTMKKLKFVVLALMIFGSINLTMAQRRDPKAMIEKETNWMIENLDLSDSQVKEVKEVNGDFTKEIQEMLQGGRPDRTKMKEMQTDKMKQMEEILSEEQFKEYAEYKEKMESKRRR